MREVSCAHALSTARISCDLCPPFYLFLDPPLVHVITRKIHTGPAVKFKPGNFDFIVMKFNSTENCYECTFTKDLLKKCKKATSLVVKD